MSLSMNNYFSDRVVGKSIRRRSALQNLAGVLERNPDIQISIEGHTDDVPYRGSGQLVDNWDLSVKRATTVVSTSERQQYRPKTAYSIRKK